jgi:acetyl-CoA C-acetyltransferase
VHHHQQGVGSGMKALLLAHDGLRAGTQDVVVAGGMESMTQAPYLLPKARGGYRLDHGAMIDHMFFDGLEDRYGPETAGRLMGTFAEDCATDYGFSGEAQDDFAKVSTQRDKAAIETSAFEWEITPVTIPGRQGPVTVRHDEQPPKAQIDKIASLKPAFRKDGTVTPANSSSISHGAAALVLMRQSDAKRLGVAPLARIIGHARHAHEPRLFTAAPGAAMRALLSKIGWSTGAVDLWEINEAFAVVTMAAICRT